MDQTTTRKPTPPCAMVIFGATGDLTKRKLFPALCNLARDGLLSDHFALVGFGREQVTTDEFRSRMAESLAEFSKASKEESTCQRLVKQTYYFRGQYDDAGAFDQLAAHLKELETKHGTDGNYLFYLAVPPQLFEPIVMELGTRGLLQQEAGKWRRVIIEKPFGHDLKSARELDERLKRYGAESQFYRIDHYLGKETVQNVTAFRFANGIIEPIWRNHYIDNVQITVAETVGVEKRAGYYESSGALRDMVPNHLMQLLSMLTMEPPQSLHAEAVRDEKAKVLSAVQPQAWVRGQYDGYRTEPGVDPKSHTETFVALKVGIQNWRWAGVPFYLRTGKKLKTRATTVVVEFKKAPHLIFEGKAPANLLKIYIQPDEGIALRLGAKVPGPSMRLSDVDLAFTYEDYFGRSPETGYETLIYDCLVGDATLYPRADTIEQGWRVVQPLLEQWAKAGDGGPVPLETYAAGSMGPAAADELLKLDGRTWHNVLGPDQLITRKKKESEAPHANV